MTREVLLSGLLGGIVILTWLVITNGPLPLSGDRPKAIPNDKGIHTELKERLTEPGLYYCPGSSEENRALYPDYGNEPLFTITVSGRTPDKFVGQLISELLCIFIAPVIAAWLLSMTSERILARFSRRVLFVIFLGLFLAVYGGISSEKPLDLTILSSLHKLTTWALAGVVIAWRIKPGKHVSA